MLIQTKVQRTHPCCGDSGGAIFAPLLMSVYITLPDLTTLYHNSHYSLFREALQKTGVNISPILLRLKDREIAENDRNLTVDR